MKTIYSLLAVCCMLATACTKYEEAPLVESPSYIRVFNNIPTTGSAMYGGRISPFLTLLVDPETDAQGVPFNAAIVGDFLATRQLFSLSYPINAANNDIAGSVVSGRGGVTSLFPSNYEYPGNAHVLTAPAINGFDLSAWAQIPSGRHRIMFVARPQNNMPFRELSDVIRNRILLDTTVELERDEVYTMGIVVRDLEEGTYGLYVRKESFVHQGFDPNKLYVGFVNLTGAQPKTVEAGFGNTYPDVPAIYYTYYVTEDIPDRFGRFAWTTLEGFNNNYFTTLQKKMDTAINYLELPLLPRSSFFYQSVLRKYTAEKDIVLSNDPSIDPEVLGTLPCLSFRFVNATDPTKSRIIYCTANPRTFNNYDPNTTLATRFTPNLNLVVNANNVNNIYATLNIMEIVYDRVYMMQVQRGFNTVPVN